MSILRSAGLVSWSCDVVGSVVWILIDAEVGSRLWVRTANPTTSHG